MVHIIPLFVGERRLDTGNAVQYPDSSPVGEAMQQFGDRWQAAAERYEQRKAQQQAFDTEIAARRLNGELAKAEADTVANAPADGAGLREAMYGQVDPYTGQVVKTGLFDTLFGNFLKEVPPDLRPGLASRKEALRDARSVRLALQQNQRRKQYEQDQVAEVHTAELKNIARSDPNDTAAFDASRQAGLDLLAKMDLDPQIRLQAEADWRARTAKERMQALIAQDPRRAAEMLSAGPVASDGMGETVRAQLGESPGGQAAAKGDWRRNKTPDEVIAQAFRDDVPVQEWHMVRRQADAANLALKVKIGAAIGRAEAEAPDEIERTGGYSGQIPGEDAYKIVYGPDEGPKRRQGLDWQIDVRKKMFDMGTMSNQAINAALNDAASDTGGSQKGNPQRLSTAVAAMRVLTRRRTDAWGAAADAVPAIATAWKAAIGGGLEDPNGYNKEAYDKAIAMALAAQERLGIENPQLVPQDVIQELAGSQNSRSLYQQEKNAKTTALLAGTPGPARAAVGRQLAAAGLGWIMPVESGYQPPSTGSIFASEAKALGKVVANAGIALGKVSNQMGYNLASLGGASIKPPENKDTYYKPANAVEDLMMQQGSDAAAWGLGEGAPKAIARVTQLVGPRAAAQAERSIGSLEVANKPTSKIASSQVEKPSTTEGTAGTDLYAYYPPNDGFLGLPVDEVLPVGTRIDRYGADFGSFAAPEGTPTWMRSLVPGTVETKPYSVYEVQKPVLVLSGKAAPWFGQGGGGTQYKFFGSIANEIEMKYLRKIEK